MTATSLQSHPKIGASWEGFALEEIIRAHQAQPESCYFWRTQDGAELDLLLMLPGKRLGFEFKSSSKVSVTPSMKIALQDLALDELYVITPEQKTPYCLQDHIQVYSLEQYIHTL